MRLFWMLAVMLGLLAPQAYAQEKSPPLPEIHSAVSKGDVAGVRRLLDADPKLLYSLTHEGAPPLLYAKSAAMARLLMERGADMYSPVPWRDTVPLVWLKKERAMEVGQALDRFDAIAMAMRGDIDAAKELLASRPFLAKARHPDDGATLLHAAALWGDRDFAESLLKLGADPSAVDSAGTEPVSLTAVWGHADIYELLVKQYKVVPTLTAGVVIADENKIDSLVPENPKGLSVPDRFGLQPIHYAARAGRPRALAVLVDRGAKVDATTGKGWTALHFAARFAGADTVGWLLEHGASPSARTDDQETPLMLACEGGDRPVVDLLIKADRSLVDAVDENGVTALAFAANCPSPGAVRALIEAGADPNGGEVPALDAACLWGSEEVFEALLKAGADPSKSDYRGEAPLHYAAKGGYIGIVEKLLRRGVDVDARNRSDQTALHFAVENDDAIITYILMNAGASTAIEDFRGRTAREIAVEEKCRNVLYLFKYLDERREGR